MEENHEGKGLDELLALLHHVRNLAAEAAEQDPLNLARIDLCIGVEAAHSQLIDLVLPDRPVDPGTLAGLGWVEGLDVIEELAHSLPLCPDEAAMSHFVAGLCDLLREARTVV